MPIRVSSKRSSVARNDAVTFTLPAVSPAVVQKPEGVSLCMIVKNEERFLEQCLRSVTGIVDEICIIDTGSTDRTVDIAMSFGARVEHREWRNDFAWARNEAIQMATRRWILMLDADEELKPESAPALTALKRAQADTTGVWIRCYNRSDDYRGTGDMSHALVRIFPNNPRIAFRGMIHEFVTLDGSTNGLPAVNAPISIVHHGYLKEVVESRNKAQRNFEIVKAAAEADPADPFAWFNVGTTAFMMQDFLAARDALEKMRELNGDSPRGFVANGYSILAETYCDKLGDPKKGEEISRSALKFSPHYANGHFQLGKALIAQKRFDEARAAFLEAIEDGKYSHLQFVVDDQVAIWKAHSEIGSSYVMQGDDRSAAEWFRKGLANAPNVQPLLLNLARALERLSELEEAQALFKRVRDEFRDDFGTVDYVNFLLRRKDGAAALDVIDESHAGLSDNVAVQLLVAAAQIGGQIRGRSAAIAYLETAAKRQPENPDVLSLLAAASEEDRYNAAVSLASGGDAKAALEHLRSVVNRQSAFFLPSMTLRASLYRSIGQLDEASESVETLLAVEPSNMEGLKLRASLAEDRGDLGRAEAALNEMVTIDGQRGAVELAAFLLRHERFEDAARIAEAALQR